MYHRDKAQVTAYICHAHRVKHSLDDLRHVCVCTPAAVGVATPSTSPTKVSAPLAAYANGNFGFALDYEDTVLYIAHPGYITMSSGLAVGEMLGSSGKDLILSIALGFEVVARIGAAMQPTPERGKLVWGEQYHPFASAVTAGKLYGLDADALDVAFGIAGTYATVP